MRRTVAVLALVAMALAACGSSGDKDDVEASRGWIGTAGDDRAWSETEGAGTALAAESRSASVSAEGYDAAGATAGGTGTAGPAEPPGGRQVTGLRAGSVDDNERFSDYLRYRSEFAALGIPVHDVDVSERHVVVVRDTDGAPVLGARVRVYASGRDPVAEARTYADGRALFFPLATDEPDAGTYRIEVTRGNAREELTVDRNTTHHTVTLRGGSDATKPVPLDVLFLIDATGSMDDEIDRLKTEMGRVAARIARHESTPDVRFAMTVYRDRGDLFVVRTFDFTDDVEAFAEALREVEADGGGDTPESLNEALHAALHEPSWRGDDAVKLVLLLADAPPHLDYDDDEDYAVEMVEAARRGIKIHPIASSGLDDQGEYIFRQLAQVTTGVFVFLTYGPDGAPGDETPHHVDRYSVLALDDLVVTLVEAELAPGRGGGQ